ncbi:DEKNAAC103641 [Brettanomyces naardenensis]|uniref:DEKNAAC103641 n=1 Tax=Brettanomyces naardenensis TaxID=13370 RepID=A0A448YP46_BRENA|nr:DEKNAAC103641 [Brettanomyces naardenensis]
MSLEQLTTELTSHFNRDDYETCAKLLTPIRIELIKNGLLVPSPDYRLNSNDMVITRSILEIGALVSINTHNMKEFSNYITLLRPFYILPQGTIPESSNRNKLLSLYLLLLLTQGDLALFHIELEKFQNFGKSVDELEGDEFLSIPIKFEKWIIDGDFNKVYEALSSKHKFPCKEFNLFETDLLNSIRLNIAENLESAYTSLPLENLKMLLFVETSKEATEFIDSFGWTSVNGVVYFNKKQNELEEEITDEKQIIKNALVYAKEMESII